MGRRCLEPHLPRAAGLPQCLASRILGSLNGLQDAAIGIGGFHGPLDEAVLIDAKDDAAGGKEDHGICGWVCQREYNLVGHISKSLTPF